VRFELHCAGENSLRYRLTPWGLDERKTWRQNRFEIADLARFDRDQMPLLVLFLGAGASVAQDLPTGDTLRNEALAGLTRQSVDRGNWRQVAEVWFHTLAERGKLQPAELTAGVSQFVSSLTLERVIAVEQDIESQIFSTTLRKFSNLHADVVGRIATERSSSTPAYDPLVEMLRHQQRLVLVTVNFDRVIEARCGDLVEAHYTEASLNTLPARLRDYAAHGGRVPLIKLHGDIGDPATIVANLDETVAGLSSARMEVLQRLVELVKEQAQRPWWYVGYSMRDADLSVMWSSPDFADAVNEHWVAPFLDASVEDFINHRRLLRWQRSGHPSYNAHERLLSLTADDFYRLLSDEVTSHWA